MVRDGTPKAERVEAADRSCSNRRLVRCAHSPPLDESSPAGINHIAPPLPGLFVLCVRRGVVAYPCESARFCAIRGPLCRVRVSARRAKLLPDFNQHDLRHRRVTTWLAEGKNPVHVKEAMGIGGAGTPNGKGCETSSRQSPERRGGSSEQHVYASAPLTCSPSWLS